MDNTDRELLNLLQEKFPIHKRPFLVLGEQLGISEDEVINRIKMLKENGYIRRIGGIFDSRSLGYFSTLCAISVPAQRIDEVSDIINGYSCVTHNYIRDGALNMWFTVIASSREKVDEVLEEIREKSQISRILSFPSEKIYKIKTNFNIKE
ncbi:AsnC family transcriptional regulator [Pseudobacteroides cellulosolvens]|uniref:siroheme decarboxylase n=1 Tax=Pseudobacteroides cellulosolvens ATCC 35603 = DSM 2933 TaxID=398512 RepID=A0A0L6JQJ9_9FIRM|nr:AsnC family transcriptional regulator [Pseudobacteroides cellulosolvens]KNY28058.1 putative transcriptional regulator, AsnC family [Pseudobacteroides cellulosolvens ATCC 35603 = DSM 2933]